MIQRKRERVTFNEEENAMGKCREHKKHQHLIDKQRHVNRRVQIYYLLPAGVVKVFAEIVDEVVGNVVLAVVDIVFDEVVGDVVLAVVVRFCVEVEAIAEVVGKIVSIAVPRNVTGGLLTIGLVLNIVIEGIELCSTVDKATFNFEVC